MFAANANSGANHTKSSERVVMSKLLHESCRVKEIERKSVFIVIMYGICLY